MNSLHASDLKWNKANSAQWTFNGGQPPILIEFDETHAAEQQECQCCLLAVFPPTV